MPEQTRECYMVHTDSHLSGFSSMESGTCLLEDKAKMQCHWEDDDGGVVFKDVVVIGNGVSGICLSYMLAGNWPYYTGEPHPMDEMLTARLHYITQTSSSGEAAQEDVQESAGFHRCQYRSNSRVQGKSLARVTRRKLECLSTGLEGRVGGRPLGLLMDQLQHPAVDAGFDLPPLLAWENRPEHKVVDHVVLGKGQPGGAWQFMDPNILTISLNRWMSLPGLDLRQWEMLVESEAAHKSGRAHCDSLQEKISACKTTSRVSVATVAAYYKDYVRRQGLEKYFHCETTVTSVRPVPGATNSTNDFGWLVEGYENKTGRRFRYRCKRAVLATGTTDLPNQLGLPGEKSNFSWVTHDLNDLESRLDQLVRQHSETNNSADTEMDPVLVVGAGLSAADAIMAARFRGIPVLHVFRVSSSEWNKGAAEKINTKTYDRLQWLPSSIYPEYHKVYEMMADGGTNYPLYKSLPGYTLINFDTENDNSLDASSRKKIVTLCAPNGQLQRFDVSIAAILIGYKPDLSYLNNNGIGYGKFPGKPIDNRSNPIDIDEFTYEVLKAPRKGLCAMGPLVGDNFVRFILGGALAILVDIHNTSAM